MKSLAQNLVFKNSTSPGKRATAGVKPCFLPNGHYGIYLGSQDLNFIQPFWDYFAMELLAVTMTLILSSHLSFSVKIILHFKLF